MFELILLACVAALCNAKYDSGYSDRPAFFGDVNGDGKADFCRFVCLKAVCAEKHIQFCCQLQGSKDQYGYCSSGGMEAGKAARPAQLIDVNKDGKADYCRFLVPPEGGDNSRPYCRLAGEKGWTEDEIEFAYS